MIDFRKRINRWIGGKCWDIGDWFFGQWLKRTDREEMEGWHKIDIHANCQPKQPNISIIMPNTWATGTNYTIPTTHSISWDWNRA